MNHDLDIDPGPQNVLTGVTRRVGFLDRLAESPCAFLEFTANVDVATLRADRMSRDHAGLDQLMRILLNNDAILVGAGLGLVSVDREIARLGGVFGQETPLKPCGKPRSPASAQARLLHLIDDLVWRHLKVLPQIRVAAVLPIYVDRLGACGPHVLEDDHFARTLGPVEGAVDLLPGDHRVDVVVRAVLEPLPVDLDGRGATAGCEALDRFHRELSVDGGLPGFYPQLPAGALQQRLRTAQCARKRGAHLDERLALGLEAEHRVETSGVVHLGRRQAQYRRDLGHRLGADVAVLLLGQPKRGQQGRALDRILRDRRVEILTIFCGKSHYSGVGSEF